MTRPTRTGPQRADAPASDRPAAPALQALPPPPAATQETSPRWRAALSAWLQSHRTYPDEARRNNDEGAVLIRFVVDREGHVVSVAVMQGSGHPSLDEAAIAMLRGARLPPFPPDMAQAMTTVTVPIRYRLER